jgi:hypothetical protein
VAWRSRGICFPHGKNKASAARRAPASNEGRRSGTSATSVDGAGFLVPQRSR